jgi:hypothetical protein
MSSQSAPTRPDTTMDKFREECGLFGIFGHPEAANLTYLGLYALQHRGQESVGIATSAGARLNIRKAMGYVADSFDEAEIAALEGTSAIGHVRYSTAGESGLRNAQPILIDCAHGEIAVAHNGNLVNAQELRDSLVRDGSIFQTTSDTEVLLHLYARSKAGSPEQALVESVAQVQDPGPARQRHDCVFGDVRPRSHRRHLDSRHRAGRGAHHRSGGREVDPAVCARARRALHFRARLFRPSRLVRLRPECQ